MLICPKCGKNTFTARVTLVTEYHDMVASRVAVRGDPYKTFTTVEYFCSCSSEAVIPVDKRPSICPICGKMYLGTKHECDKH